MLALLAVPLRERFELIDERVDMLVAVFMAQWVRFYGVVRRKFGRGITGFQKDPKVCCCSGGKLGLSM